MSDSEDGGLEVRYNDIGHILDESGKTFEQQLDREFDPNGIECQFGGAMLRNRYKAPFQKVAKHDMKADAIQLVVDYFMLKQVPYYVGYVAAINYIQTFAEQFEIKDVPYKENAVEEDIHEGAQWAKKIMDELPEYCRQLARGEYDYTDRDASWYRIAVSCDINKGQRKTQEDRLLCLPSLNMHVPQMPAGVSLFGILDGHGGSSIASYATGQLPFLFSESYLQCSNDVGKALNDAMIKLDARVADRCKLENWNNVGATAVIAGVTNSHIAVRWLGDSPAFILSSSGVEKITRPHVPTDEAEAKRIMDVGGELIYIQGELRVNGVLNVTRAIGDLAGRPMVSGESEGIVIERTPEQYLLLLMCDGVADMYKDDELYNVVAKFVRSNDSDEYSELSELIVRTALNRGSSDNCTCVAVFLRPPSDLWDFLESGDVDDLSGASSYDSD